VDTSTRRNTMPRITGASVWEQDLYDYVVDHVATEGAILDEYERLAADDSGSPAFRYLAGLILADERRHHQLYNELAESIRQMAELRLEEEPIPSLHGLRTDRHRIEDATERLLAAERADAKELKQFAKMLKEVRDTTLWALLVELMQDDTAKHIKILSFIRDRAEKAIT
jgi:bacterioferritin (cytochrome b1)